MTGLRALIDRLEFASGFIELKIMNGMYVVYFGGHPDRPRDTPAQLDELLDHVRESAPGSYRLIYWRDDEDPAPPGANEFHVKVIARGQTIEKFDPFLSPVVPTIEE